jgi:hypothetical protein
MNVSDIINMMALTGVGLEDPTPEDREIYLKFINLANLELYRLAIFSEKSLYRDITNITTDANGVYHFPIFPLEIEKVICTSLLKNLHFDVIENLQKYDTLLNKEGTPSKWYFNRKNLVIYPVQTAPIDLILWTIPNPIHLTLDTAEMDIPYPPVYHDILMHGASYFLFQSEGGKNREKMIIAEKKWTDGKTRLLDFLQAYQKPQTSTFENV